MNSLQQAALAVYERARAAHVESVQRETADKIAAASDKTGLGDGYWQPAHFAGLKAKSAAAFLHAVMEESK